MRAPLKGTFRTQFLLPAGLLAVAALASLAMFFPGTDAGASGHADTAQVPAIPTSTSRRAPCGTVNIKGVTGTTRNAGNPFNSSSRFCLNGHLISYGSRYITYTNPPRSFIAAGQLLFAADVLELPREQRQRRRPRRAGHHRAQPAGRRRRHRRLLGEHGPHAGRRREGGRGRAAAEPADAPAGARAGRLGQLARPGGARRAQPAPGRGQPVGGAGPLLAQLRRVPHHRGLG